jgi:hypothetical protein
MKKSSLDGKTILGQLEELARRLEIKVRYEPIRGEGPFYMGGLCRVRGENILIINSKATMRDKIQALVRAVKQFDISQIYMRPALREFLGRFPDERENRP